jgi:hypothetical protein
MDVNIRQLIDREEFDYTALVSALSSYAEPRRKISSLLRKGVIVRVKKGLYVFGDDYRKRPFSRELLANLIYGPSYVSLDYALAFHGLIPEIVTVLSSVTTKRPKEFQTPVGNFVFRRAKKEIFHLGMTRVEQGPFAFLIASPERALADKLREDRAGVIRSRAQIEQYLFENLRLDQREFEKMDGSVFEAFLMSTRCQKNAQALKLLRTLKGGSR